MLLFPFTDSSVYRIILSAVLAFKLIIKSTLSSRRFFVFIKRVNIIFRVKNIDICPAFLFRRRNESENVSLAFCVLSGYYLAFLRKPEQIDKQCKFC